MSAYGSLKKESLNRKPFKCPRLLTGISALGNEYTVCMPVRMRFWKEVVSRYVCFRKCPFREFPLHYQRRNLIYISAGPEVNDLLHYFIYKHNLLVRPSSLDKPFLLFVQDLLFLLGCLVLPRINKGKKNYSYQYGKGHLFNNCIISPPPPISSSSQKRIYVASSWARLPAAVQERSPHSSPETRESGGN